MTTYTQLKIDNNVLVEVTNRSLYFEYDTDIKYPIGIGLSYDEFEYAYTCLRNNQTATIGELVLEPTDEYIHLITDMLTVSFHKEDLTEIYEFYVELRPELYDSNRKTITVWKNGKIVDTKFASEDATSETIASLQQDYSDEYEIKVSSTNKMQNLYGT